MNRFVATLSSTLLAATLPAMAQNMDHGGHSGHGTAAVAVPASDFTSGEVRKIDKDAGKVTIRHGAIANLEMPPMTMVFKAKDPSVLDRIKVGDSVSFKAEKIEGVFTVTELRPAS